MADGWGTVGGRVTAVLGPTNTGKTHLAMERLLGHRSGMIGFPLRLLARENYDKIVRLKGAANVALVTGEERIVPPGARWFVCTVESMPIDRPVEFLAVDEVQLAADPDRGHIFTDRILRARGLHETMLLGAETMKPILRSLVPQAEFVTRPRLSTLSYIGHKKPTRLPRRSAVVAFSAAEVYELAELMRRQRGGCAVVLGALSPRARNAQVELYQSGEVDYLVATDAIGMGLNMDLNHVAFARLVKFDGFQPRRLTAPEVAQIAGRAGRHMNDGTFGTTAEAGPMDPDLVEQVESNRFDPVTAVGWRNPDLDFRSVEALLASLERGPPRRELKRRRDADDHRTLAALARMSDVMERARGPAAVRQLWEVCQVPDFRKTLADIHVKLVAQIYLRLTERSKRLPPDWVDRQIQRLDRTDGDIEQLSVRIAHIRTWTYVSHRPDWMADSLHWQERTRAIEDRLSDALHERLTQRFVDRRGAFLARRLDEPETLLAGVAKSGEVVVEGHPIGRLEGFTFHPDITEQGESERRLLAAARRALKEEIADRVRRLTRDPDDAFALSPAGRLLWHGAEVARLAPGPGRLSPQVELLDSDFLEGERRERVRSQLAAWLDRHLRRVLAPLYQPTEAALQSAGRGLAFQLREGLGVVARREAAEPGPEDRKALTRLGVRFGLETIYSQPALTPERMALRAMLDCIQRGVPVTAPPTGKSAPRDPKLTDGFYRAIGYLPLGPRVLRVDTVERLAQEVRRLARGEEGATQGGTALSPQLLAQSGASPSELPAILTALGYRVRLGEAGGVRISARRRPREPQRRPSPDSPFAILAKRP